MRDLGLYVPADCIASNTVKENRYDPVEVRLKGLELGILRRRLWPEACRQRAEDDEPGATEHPRCYRGFTPAAAP